MVDWGLRSRALLDKYFAVVIVSLVVLTLAGGWLAYTTHVSPGTVTETRPGPFWETTGQFTHAATVQEENPIYAVGTTLRNRSVYFTRISPRLDGRFRFTYAASETGSLQENVSLALVLRGIERGDRQRETTVHWRKSRRLASGSNTSVSPSESLIVPFSIDTNAVVNRTKQIREQLGGSPGNIEVFVRATVTFRGQINGNTISRTNTYKLPVTTSEDTYRIEASNPTVNRHESTRRARVQRTYGPLRKIGSPLITLVSLFGLTGLLTLRVQNGIALSAAERERLIYQEERNDFDEWVSAIRLPDEAFTLPQAEAASLGALVDFAIDTDNSVVEDPDDGAYYVVHGGYLYSYHPPKNISDGDPTDQPATGPADKELDDEVGTAPESTTSDSGNEVTPSTHETPSEEN